MRPRDWFSVGVRLFGIWMLIGVLDTLRIILLIRLDLFQPAHTPMAIYSIHAGVNGIAGLYLLLCANHLTQLVYPSDNRGSEVADGDQTDGPLTENPQKPGDLIDGPPA